MARNRVVSESHFALPAARMLDIPNRAESIHAALNRNPPERPLTVKAVLNIAPCSEVQESYA